MSFFIIDFLLIWKHPNSPAFISDDLVSTMPVEASVKTQGAENRSHPAVIRVYDETGNVVETHEQAGDFKEW